ncbi:MAG: B12-dependent PpsR anti-repressor AppaA [Rhodobacteraceae bacterium HLUCCA08]|nr:MAG: B12-dependent PpsR anti-repressor AppaA [Rhodobacteraceae bacterium HLUCCA08]
MQDKSATDATFSPSRSWVDAVANRALAVVASRSAGDRRQSDPELLAMMRQCLLGGDRDACKLTIRTMTDAGVPIDDIADLYIPDLAHQLGEDWCEDRLSFAEVTIGTSKLQTLLREISSDWAADKIGTPDLGAALVIVGAEENHTLGAQVLAARLRRRGMSVRVQLSATAGDVATTVERADFDMVMISVSRRENLEMAQKFVEIVRNLAKRPPPIVVGGALEVSTRDITDRTGADFATSDIDEALTLCGLDKRNRGDERRQSRG